MCHTLASHHALRLIPFLPLSLAATRLPLSFTRRLVPATSSSSSSFAGTISASLIPACNQQEVVRQCCMQGRSETERERERKAAFLARSLLPRDTHTGSSSSSDSRGRRSILSLPLIFSCQSLNPLFPFSLFQAESMQKAFAGLIKGFELRVLITRS